MSFFKEELKKIKAFAFDVDGVLARSEMVLHPSGDLMRSMNSKDGFALHFAVQAGYPVAIITGARSESIRVRFNFLGISDVYLDSTHKWSDLLRFIDKYHISASEVLYMGDDLPDYDVMSRVGLPTCPNDAVSEIQSVSRYISSLPGGEGCVRDVIEQVLRAQHQWNFVGINEKQQ